jgi:hypothetical protein
MSCIEEWSFSVLSGELDDARLIVLFTGEGEELRALPILKALVAVFVKFIL